MYITMRAVSQLLFINIIPLLNCTMTGNVQMRGEYPTSISLTLPVEPQTWEEITGPIVKAIEKAEAEFQKNVSRIRLFIRTESLIVTFHFGSSM